MPVGCGCEEEVCEYSRIRDSFEISCITELPQSHEQGIYELCDFFAKKSLPTCPPCPDEPWVVLTKVTLPERGVPIMNENIDNYVRRPLFSTAVLQEQLIKCCCEAEAEPVLTISKTIEKVELQNNSEVVVCKITIKNVGKVTAKDVVVKDTVFWKNSGTQNNTNYTPFNPVIKDDDQWQKIEDKIGQFTAKIDRILQKEEKELKLIFVWEYRKDYRNTVNVTCLNLKKEYNVSEELKYNS
jgi:hypothetical protein